MTRAELSDLLRPHRLAVIATVADGGAPEAAIVGIAVTDELELVFDTLGTTRKVSNLRANPRIAVVIGGWDREQTIQLEGIADFPTGAALAPLQAAYYAAYPDGVARASWPELVYVRIRPTWARYSDFEARPAPRIEELALA